jgi:hypothetical protein
MAVVTRKLAYNEMELLKLYSTCPLGPCCPAFNGRNDFYSVVSLSVRACQSKGESWCDDKRASLQ